jgi:hypothetical protein
MDDLDLDPYDSKRIDRQRAPGPFGSNAELPEKVAKWKSRVHPTTKKQTKLLHLDWERGPALRILGSLETHTFDWTKSAVSKRNSLNKSDNNDIAPTMFRLDPFGAMIRRGAELRALRASNAEDEDSDTDGANARQLGKIRTWIADRSIRHITEDQRPQLEFHCTLFPSDVTVYTELVRAYDAALCHFLYDCCTAELGRLLNAERLKAPPSPSYLPPILLLPHSNSRP